MLGNWYQIIFSLGGELDRDKTAYSELEGSSNLLSECVLRCFPNLQHLVVDTTDRSGIDTYQFSLRKWFALFCALPLKKCTLNAVCKDREEEDGRRSWLFYVYQVVGPFASETVKVELKCAKNSNGHFQDSLVFERV